MSRLANKIALVTGASRGIGRAIAIRLAKEGALVAVHYHTAHREAEATLAFIRKAGGDGFIVSADLGESSGPRMLAKDFIQALKEYHASSFDILVNNAGIDRRQTIEHVTEADFDSMVQVNFKAPFFLVQALLPFLKDGGHIINVSSMAARSSFPTMPVYGPMKAALSTLTRILAAHLGSRGIRVNAVMPGATATDMNPAAKDLEAGKALARTVALGRVGQPDDIARVIAFLASDESGWITGENIEVSGGQRL